MNRLLLKVTYRCTSRCRHCLYCCSAMGDGTLLTPDDVELFIRKSRPTEYVLLTGGEASLEPELLLRGIEVATSLGIRTWLVSNGSWGRDPHLAEELARAMRARGLTRASISIDALHQEFVPADSALEALRALRIAGVSKVEAISTFVDWERALPIDRRTEELVDTLSSEPGIRLDIRPRVTFAGRGIFDLEPYASRLSLDEALGGEEGCEEGADPSNLMPRSYYDVGPDGRVLICAGFAFPGSLRTMDFDDIIAGDNILGHPLVAAFHARAVRGLLDVGAAHGYAPRTHYSGRCHLCWDIRNFLRPFYPDVLTPVHAYEAGPRSRAAGGAAS